VVTIDFGFNGTNLTLQGATGATLGGARCVSGLAGSIFGQVSFCNGVAFFAAVNKDIAAGLTTIPAVATATKAPRVTCPTTRNFNMIDQDQSDNVTTQYLLDGNGLTAQNTPANKAAMANSTVRGVLSNGPMRNFFNVSYTFDTYNTERFDYMRGPNSILFGAGTISGSGRRSAQAGRTRSSGR